MAQTVPHSPGSRPNSARRIAWVTGLFVLVILVMMGLIALQAYMFAGVGAYIRGEGLWAKAQKNAVYELVRYAQTREEHHYQAFVEALSVPHGDRKARTELMSASPDLQRARAGLLQGENDPEDLGAMIGLFQYFRAIPALEQSLQTWREGDRHIRKLAELGRRLRTEIRSPSPDQGAIVELLAQADRLNEQLTAIENRFSAQQAQGARWLSRRVQSLGIGLAMLLTLGALWTALVVARRMRRAESALVESETRFRRLADANTIGVLFWNVDGTVTEANSAFLNIVGYDRASLKEGRLHWSKLGGPASESNAAHTRQRMKPETGTFPPYETELLHRNGSRVPVLIGGATFEGGPDHGAAFVLDLSERKRNEEQLQLAATVFDASGEGIMITDPEGRILSVNPAFSELSGYRVEALVGQTPRMLRSGLMPESFYDELYRELRREGFWQGEILDRREDGEVIPLWATITAVHNNEGAITHYVALYSDITDRKAREEHLRHQAHHDSLTGLPNRTLFHDRARQALLRAERHGTHPVVMFLDLDGFKTINDTRGHEVGDRVLSTIAQRLRDGVRGEDTISRVGGDEFAILLEHLDGKNDVAEVADKLIAAVGQSEHWGDSKLKVTASIGISIYPYDGEDIESLLRHSDRAMYRAKTKGRNTYQFFADLQ